MPKGSGFLAAISMKTTTLVPAFGSNALNADDLESCCAVRVDWRALRWRMSEVAHFKARTLVINDKHLHLMNLASIAAEPIYGPKLNAPFEKAALVHPWTLEVAQRALP